MIQVDGNSGAIAEILEGEVRHHEHSPSRAVFLDRVIYSAEISQSAGLPITSFSYLVLKRLIDTGVSGASLLLLFPVILAVGLAVRLSSPGPVFYRERRVGRFGRHFTIYKFRSMYTKEYLRDVLKYEENEHAQMQRRTEKKHLRDPRVTAVGAILRKLSLDELPQLFNVLKGDMSLIGPRPVVDAELMNYGSYVVLYKLMYPGLSGLWQVSGRNDVSYKSRVRKDVAYCKRWSPLLDFVILARTVPAVLKGKGAY
jgi:lipopolysaccharide/colanic/teichoic acid biosynthesis glycosyltransferase